MNIAVRGVKRTARRAFVATGQGLDEEMAMKIARHRRTRSSSWKTAEVPLGLVAWMKRHAASYRVILVDCLTMWVSNQYEQEISDSRVLKDAKAILSCIRKSHARAVLVSNELGMGLVPADRVSRRFRELAGALNQLIAAEADQVFLVVSGLPVQIK